MSVRVVVLNEEDWESDHVISGKAELTYGLGAGMGEEEGSCNGFELDRGCGEGWGYGNGVGSGYGCGWDDGNGNENL